MDDEEDEWLFNDPQLLQQLECVETHGSPMKSLDNNLSLSVAAPSQPSKTSKRKPSSTSAHAKNRSQRQLTIEMAFGGTLKTAASSSSVIDLTAAERPVALSQSKPLIVCPSIPASNSVISSRYRIPVPHDINHENINSWVYPINYPKRSYQFNIIKTCLFHNTLVCLPTGLGKTFIAAVVMFNYWRWFTRGKVIFMAPTKPLVAQQKEACFKITGLTQLETVELTGSLNPNVRRTEWRTKRAFFITPQILQNDLENGICTADDIVCIVVDEAHRATGNYAYCECVKLIEKNNPFFRLIALSATPGSDPNAVQQVVRNLNISRVELRTEESLDLSTFTHVRKKETIVVTPNEIISQTLNVLCETIMKPYLERMKKNRALFDDDPLKLSKYSLLTARTSWRSRNSGRNGNGGYIESDFAVMMSLAHALDLLIRHGITPFYRYLASVVGLDEDAAAQTPKGVKGHLRKNSALMALLADLKSKMSSPTFVGHRKLEKLEAIVLNHFMTFNDGNDNSLDHGGLVNSRVMIFSEFRDSVDDIVQILNKHDPILRTMSFIGQASKNGKGLSQKEQLKVVQKFKEGGYNILVATCIGEEGLDIGEVDLIVCYDAQSSPIRMLQRMGRTGRKRDGRIVTLLAAGKEEAQFRKVETAHKRVQTYLASGKLEFYSEDIRMVPANIEPQVDEKVLSIPEYQSSKSESSSSATTNKKQSRTKKSSLNDIFSATEWRVYTTLYQETRTNAPLNIKKALDKPPPLHYDYSSNCGTSKSNELFMKLRNRMQSRILEDKKLTTDEWVESLESKLSISRRKTNIEIHEMVDEESFITKDNDEQNLGSDDSLIDVPFDLNKRPMEPLIHSQEHDLTLLASHASPIFENVIESKPPGLIIIVSDKNPKPDRKDLLALQSEFLSEKSIFKRLELLNTLASNFDSYSDNVQILPGFQKEFDNGPAQELFKVPLFKQKIVPSTPTLSKKVIVPRPSSIQVSKKLSSASIDFDEDDDDIFDTDFSQILKQTESEIPKKAISQSRKPSLSGLPSFRDDDDDDDIWDNCDENFMSELEQKMMVNRQSIASETNSEAPSTVVHRTRNNPVGNGKKYKMQIISSPMSTTSNNNNNNNHNSISLSPVRPKKEKPKCLRIATLKRRKQSKFIDCEVSVDDELSGDTDEEEDYENSGEEYSSSLDGFIKRSDLTEISSPQSSICEPSYQPRGYKMKLQHGNFSQRINDNGRLDYVWADDLEEGEGSSNTLKSFIVEDDEIEFEDDIIEDDEISCASSSSVTIAIREKRKKRLIRKL